MYFHVHISSSQSKCLDLVCSTVHVHTGLVTYLRALSSDDPLMVICERRERGGGRGERERWKSEEGGKVGGEVGGRGQSRDKGMKRLD